MLFWPLCAFAPHRNMCVCVALSGDAGLCLSVHKQQQQLHLMCLVEHKCAAALECVCVCGEGVCCHACCACFALCPACVGVCRGVVALLFGLFVVSLTRVYIYAPLCSILPLQGGGGVVVAHSGGMIRRAGRGRCFTRCALQQLPLCGAVQQAGTEHTHTHTRTSSVVGGMCFIAQQRVFAAAAAVLC